uniref:Type I polyketide synthase n=1 Tax=Gambierdiscus polynesiensis TaxID=439318 RepID=A0A1S6K884_9DINO|nr:type I polyketide synthase [Gambierdiscus polynesiensis]
MLNEQLSDWRREGPEPKEKKPPKKRNPLPELPRPGFDVSASSPRWCLDAMVPVESKGFCVVDATSTVSELDLTPIYRSFHPAWEEREANASVAAGLLGREGSRWIRELLPEDGEDQDEDQDPDEEERRQQRREVFQHLHEKDELLWDWAERMGSHLSDLRGDFCITSSLLHMSFLPGPSSTMWCKAAPLIRETALQFQNLFVQARLMIVLFLGPGRGDLELQLGHLEVPRTEKIRIPTRHGVMVVMRPQIIARCHQPESTEPSFAISRFVLPSVDPLTDAALLGRAFSQMPFVENLRRFARGAEDELGRTTRFNPGSRLQVMADACYLPGDCMTGTEFADVILPGLDSVLAIPAKRFNVDDYFDEVSKEECAANNMIYTKHCSFIDGFEFFSPGTFCMDPSEAKKLHASTLCGMEVALEAVRQAGFPVKPGSDWDFRSKYSSGAHRRPYKWDADLLVAMNCADAGLSDACIGEINDPSWREDQEGHSPVPSHVDPHRIKFILGLKGQSRVFETDDSSSLVALSWAVSSWWGDSFDLSSERELKPSPPKDFSLVVASDWNLSILMFVHACARGLLDKTGRCRCFNRDGHGHVRAEGIAALVLTTKQQRNSSSIMALGDLMSAAISSTGGRGASLTRHPSRIMEAAMDSAVMKGGVATTDISVVECHALGSEIPDSWEVAAVAKIFPLFLPDEVLQLSATKSNMGSGRAGSGLFSLLRVLREYRSVGPALHLNVLNPYIDNEAEFHGHLLFGTEPTYQLESPGPMACINSFGNSGIYASVIVRGEPPDYPLDDFPPVTFWPAGGGRLPPFAVPNDGYYLAGSFNEWKLLRMQEQETGVWEATITLGDRFELFRIYVDDKNRALHPPMRQGLISYCDGPDKLDDSDFRTWQIGADESDEDCPDPSRRERGQPGDRYEVQFCVAGNWRNVKWRRVPALTEDGAVGVPPSNYYVVCNWNRVPTKMTQDPNTDGLWVYEADVRKEAKSAGVPDLTAFMFYIIRNEDFNFAFFPGKDCEEDPSVQMRGPCFNNELLCWMLDPNCWKREGSEGNEIKIEFQRTFGFADDVRKLSWTYPSVSRVADTSAAESANEGRAADAGAADSPNEGCAAETSAAESPNEARLADSSAAESPNKGRAADTSAAESPNGARSAESSSAENPKGGRAADSSAAEDLD